MIPADTRLAPLREPGLSIPEAFLRRAAALDRLDFLLAAPDAPEDAEALRGELESVDAGLFASLRARIRDGLRGEALRAALDRLVPSAERLPRDAPGYDALDALVDGILFPEDPPAPSLPLEPGMVGLQQVPARVILELTERARLGPDARLCDVGSGLGRVALLASLLTGCAARGVERDPAFCTYARACAARLEANVPFTEGDARAADFPEEVLFLFTPLRGAALAEVLERMRAQASPAARVFAYGPCIEEVARAFPARDLGPPPTGVSPLPPADPYRLGVFAPAP